MTDCGCAVPSDTVSSRRRSRSGGTGLRCERALRGVAGLAVAFIGLGLVVPQPVRAAEWAQLEALEKAGARVSAAVLDLQDLSVVAERNAENRLTPASLTKLAIAAASLEAWPVDKTFRTRIVSIAPPADGAVAGDLILQGDGDPSLDDHSLWSLAAQLKGRGITHVRGGLIVNAAPFGTMNCETSDRCKALERSDTAYNAPLSSIGVDFGNWCVSVRPTTLAQPAEVQGCGVRTLPVPVEGTIRTVSRGSRQTFWVERVTRAGEDRLRMGGDIPLNGAQELYRSMSDPAKGAGLLLAQMLAELGIRIEGGVTVRPGVAPPEAVELARIEGLNLREQLGRMLRYSNNYIADVLTLNLAAWLNKEPPTELSAASRILSGFVARAQGAAKLSRPETPAPLYSGSGLTPENLISASELVGLLAHQYRDTRRFPAFYGSLVVPRDAPFQFLRDGTSAWLDRVALKTGTMQDPHSVCGLAGYLRKKDGGWMAFAVIVNGGASMPRVPLFRAMAAARGDIEAILDKH
jgi:D-alanyl-D-alanine carboxypeptidase/D-alanyl-D-alanine-endopeptidase (penicillin-binding protein 4)